MKQTRNHAVLGPRQNGVEGGQTESRANIDHREALHNTHTGTERGNFGGVQRHDCCYCSWNETLVLRIFFFVANKVYTKK